MCIYNNPSFIEELLDILLRFSISPEWIALWLKQPRTGVDYSRYFMLTSSYIFAAARYTSMKQQNYQLQCSFEDDSAAIQPYTNDS